MRELHIRDTTTRCLWPRFEKRQEQALPVDVNKQINTTFPTFIGLGSVALRCAAPRESM